MVMASCDNFDLPNPPGQTNPEPDGIFENSGLVMVQADQALDLVALNAANENADVATITELINFPENYTLSIDMQVSADNSFSKTATIATTIDGDAVTVNPDALNGAIQEVKTKAPGTYDIYARYVAYAELGATRMRLGGLDATYCAAAYSIKTLDPAKVMEQSYYFVPCDASGNPVLSSAIRMNNTSGNASVYDNPEFAIKIDVTEQESIDGYRWKVLPESSVTAGNTAGALGCNPSDEAGLSGKLGESYSAGEIHLLGPVQIVINVETDSYSVNYALDNLWPLSGTTLAKPADAMLLYTDNYINYTGVSALNGMWYCAGQPSYRNPGDILFYQDDAVGFEDSEDGLTRTGGLTTSSAGGTLRTPVSGNKLYWIDVNLVQATYSITALETLSVIGSGNGWDLETATVLTPSKDLKVWTAENVVIGDEFKINANGAWDIGFSGTSVPDATGKQVYNVNKQDGGDNLMAVPGTYKVTVDFSTKPYTVVLE